MAKCLVFFQNKGYHLFGVWSANLYLYYTNEHNVNRVRRLRLASVQKDRDVLILIYSNAASLHPLDQFQSCFGQQNVKTSRFCYPLFISNNYPVSKTT